MGTLAVDQILGDGTVVLEPDTPMSSSEKESQLRRALPGSAPMTLSGVTGVRSGRHIIFFKQVTHLGSPWPSFKKRIQIPRAWVSAEAEARKEGLQPHFVGVYRFGEVTLFVDFAPEPYVRRAANNSAAHVSTNDLYQGLMQGTFSREDSRGNSLTTVRADLFAAYLQGQQKALPPAIQALQLFNQSMLSSGRLEALASVREMHDWGSADAFQAEWPGFFLEYRLDRFLQEKQLEQWIQYQKVKGAGLLDYDLVLHDETAFRFFGDLKASNAAKHEAPGNDAEDLRRCVEEYGRFWYVVYEHQTWHAKCNGNQATIDWNEWRKSQGYFARAGKTYNPLSYAARFKEAVDFDRMFVLEVNPANIGAVLGDFRQGHQPDGSARALKVMIKKRNIDNFLVFVESRADLSAVPLGEGGAGAPA